MPALINHPDVTQPADPEATIWRYIEHEKLESLLREQALYFSSLSQLEDTHEGSIPEADSVIQKATGVGDQFSGTRRNSLSLIRINCWTSWPAESDAFWRIYGSANPATRTSRAVAIRSTYSTLVRAIGKTEFPIYAGAVIYKDYKTAAPSGTLNMFAPVFWKRIAFAYENEMRLAGYFFVAGSAPSPEEAVQASPLVPCDLDALIQQIVISPYAAPGYVDEVRLLIESVAPTLQGRVHPSALDTTPIH